MGACNPRSSQNNDDSESRGISRMAKQKQQLGGIKASYQDNLEKDTTFEMSRNESQVNTLNQNDQQFFADQSSKENGQIVDQLPLNQSIHEQPPNIKQAVQSQIVKKKKFTVVTYGEEVPPDVLDSIVFGENISIDWRKYPMLHRKCWDSQKSDKELLEYPKKEFHTGESIQLLHETIEFLFAYVDTMNLHDKDIFIVVGPSRTGKGTLLAALKGQKMKLFKRRAKDRQKAFYKDVATATFMAPEGPDGEPIVEAIMSHSHNSHTIVPKIPQDKPEYSPEYNGLDGTWLVDFPGMFESKGLELDIAIDLTLQRVLLQARSAKILVLVSATSLTPESSIIVTQIQERIKHMFKDPEEHLVVGITKAKMVEMSLSYEDILPTANGENGEDISFRGYQVIQVEQDNPETIIEMINKVNQVGDVKPYVKLGFFDYRKIEQIFTHERAKITDALNPDKKGHGLANLLAEIFENIVPPPQQSLQQILEFTAEANRPGLFDKSQLDEIVDGLQQLNVQALNIKECWESLGSVMEIKSILGLLDEFKFIQTILDNENYDNPSLNCGLYRVDQDCLDQLKKAILTARDDQLQEIKQVIEALFTAKLIEQAQKDVFMARWGEIKEKIEGQLENMGFDKYEQTQAKALWKEAIASPFLIVGHAGMKFCGLIKKIGTSLQSSQSKDFKNFKDKMEQAFEDYIHTSLGCAENQVNIQLQRQDQLINVIGQQKKLKEQTHSESIEEAIQIEQKYDLTTFNRRFIKCQQLIRYKPTQSQLNKNKINILSIDGGGYRNIIPIIFLMELEIRARRNISSMFNMVGGTSFGAIIAACLTSPTLLNQNKPKFLSKDILSRWNRQIPQIFSNENYKFPFNYQGYKATIKFFEEHTGDTKYDGKNRRQLLENTFQQLTLNKAIRKLMIPAFDNSNGNGGQTVWFDSTYELPNPQKKGQEIIETENTKMQERADQMKFSDAVLASTTTPKYFKPYVMEEESKYIFVDGGNGPVEENANNPTISLIIEAQQGHGYSLENINVISLGTGKLPEEGIKGKSQQKVDEEMYWKGPLAGNINYQTEMTHQKVENMLPPENYVRLQPTLPADRVFKFDDHNYEDNQLLVDIACDYLANNQEQISKALNLLI